MSLRLEHDGPIARLLIDRADKRNAFTLAMWQAVPRLLAQAAALPDLRLLLVQSSHPGGAFCAGADIAELLANKHDSEWLAANQAAINKAQHDLARFPLPTIAYVEGDAVGGGCGLALACDMRIATASARFGITPAKLGIVYPLHDVKLLVDLVGPGQAKRMLFSGMLLDADEAHRIGLVEMLAGGPSCIQAAIVAASRNSTKAIKGLVQRVLDGQSADDAGTLAAFAAAFAGEDFAEGAAAFTARRVPKFRG